MRGTCQRPISHGANVQNALRVPHFGSAASYCSPWTLRLPLQCVQGWKAAVGCAAFPIAWEGFDLLRGYI
jgi:hypothetical protein